ncbi:MULTISPECIES: hypothetical protein [Rhizobium]|uniref:Uncharacterized protein n=1 Tax=Rhizobium paranaense TaxID=1650438 RepID=A0A7W8XS06_9HYPH|nr:hypothetical protein [Rhizobium paranaense]MBB5574498.1 hypothetical protein [Rhizobium paranaense]
MLSSGLVVEAAANNRDIGMQQRVARGEFEAANHFLGFSHNSLFFYRNIDFTDHRPIGIDAYLSYRFWIGRSAVHQAILAGKPC